MTNSEKYKRKLIKDNFSLWFRLAISLDLIICEIERDSRAEQHIVTWYVDKNHPLFMLYAIVTLAITFVLNLFFFLGIILWVYLIIIKVPGEKDPQEIRINMRRHNRGEKGSKRAAAKCCPGLQKFTDFSDFSVLEDDENELDLGIFEKTTTIASFTNNSPEGVTAVKLSNSAAVVYDKSKSEAKKELYDEFPEEDIRLENLKKALKENRFESVERFFKRKCNIYPIDLGYALERVGRDKTHLFLKLNLNYVKVWEGEDKKELLNTLISDYYAGRILPTARYTLEKALRVIDFDTNKLGEVEQDLINQYKNREYRISTLPEELGVVKREFKS